MDVSMLFSSPLRPHPLPLFIQSAAEGPDGDAFVMMFDLKLKRTLAIGIIVVSLTVSVGMALAAPRQDRSTQEAPTTESK